MLHRLLIWLLNAIEIIVENTKAGYEKGKKAGLSLVSRARGKN